MARMTHYSKPTLAAAAAGREVPTWSVAWAYLLACGVTDEEQEAWRDEHQTAARGHKAWVRRAPGGQPGQAQVVVPRPEDVRTPEDLAGALDALRRSRGLSFRDMERRARSWTPPRTLPIQTAHDAISGGRPSEHTLEAILEVCDVPEAARRAWFAAWRRTVIQTGHDRAVVRVMRMLAPSPQSAELDEALKAVNSLAVLTDAEPANTNTPHTRELYVEAAKLLNYPDNPAIRLNGIRSLERIAVDSPNDQHTVVEMLSAFVRSRSTDPALRPPAPTDGTDPPPVREATDVRTAVQVLGRLPRLPGVPRADLTGADLTGASSLAHLDLTNADLRAVPLGRADLTDARLDGATLTGARLDEATLDGAWLDGATLIAARLRRANLIYARLSWANLTGARLREADLTGARLRGATLTGARLDKANLTGAWMDGATLTGAWMDGATLDSTWLAGANLTDTRLAGANLTDTRLAGANLTDARLQGANLTNAFLVNARLDGANLTDAKLTGADLTGATGLTQGQLDVANGDATTRLPAGIARPAPWSTIPPGP
nr:MULTISPECIES: pentapeptide repeat-containing protein [unclassified Frankia]